MNLAFKYFSKYSKIYFTPCSSVYIVNFEQVNVGWVFLLFTNNHQKVIESCHLELFCRVCKTPVSIYFLIRNHSIQV